MPTMDAAAMPDGPRAARRASPNRKPLTQLFVDRVRPPAQGYMTLWDTNLPGFGLRISARGRKSWVAMYRVAGGKEVMETLGTTALIPNVRDARERARASMDKARQGIHPVLERKRQEADAVAETREQAYTFEKLIDDFINGYHEQRKRNRASTIYEARRLLNRAAATIGSRSVREITKPDILALINDLAASSVLEAAGVLRNMRAAFAWACEQDLIKADPTAGVRNPQDRTSERERVLSDAELVALWRAAEADGYPFGRIAQLLILTGQRKREVGNLSWNELDLANRLWTLPAARSKNRRAHDIPLSQQAVAIIERLPRFDGYVFSVRDGRSIKGYADAKARTDKRLAEILPRSMQPWTWHDIRRTVATGLQRLGIKLEVTEAVLNHVSGSRGGIVGIYQRHDYADEKRAALDTWGRFIEHLVHPERTEAKATELRVVASP